MTSRFCQSKVFMASSTLMPLGVRNRSISSARFDPVRATFGPVLGRRAEAVATSFDFRCVLPFAGWDLAALRLGPV